MTSVNPENSVLFVLNSQGNATKIFSSELGVSDDQKTYMSFNDLILSMENQTKELEKIASDRIQKATFYVKHHLRNESNRFFNNVRFSEEYQFLQSQQMSSLKPSELYNDIFLSCCTSSETTSSLTNIFVRSLVWNAGKNSFVIPKSKAEVSEGKFAFNLINSINKICGEGPKGPVVDGFTFAEIKKFVTLPDHSESKTSASESKTSASESNTSDSEKYRTFILNQISVAVNLLIIQAFSYGKATDEELSKMDMGFEPFPSDTELETKSTNYMDNLDLPSDEEECGESGCGIQGGGQRGGGGQGVCTIGLILLGSIYHNKNKYDNVRDALRKTQELTQYIVDTFTAHLIGGHTDTERFPPDDQFIEGIGGVPEFPHVMNLFNGGEDFGDSVVAHKGLDKIDAELFMLAYDDPEVPKIINDIHQELQLTETQKEDRIRNGVRNSLLVLSGRVEKAINTSNSYLEQNSLNNTQLERIASGMNNMEKTLEKKLDKLSVGVDIKSLSSFEKIFSFYKKLSKAIQADFRFNFIKQKKKFLKGLDIPTIVKQLASSGKERNTNLLKQIWQFVGSSDTIEWYANNEMLAQAEGGILVNELKKRLKSWQGISDRFKHGLSMFAIDFNIVSNMRMKLIADINADAKATTGRKKFTGAMTAGVAWLEGAAYAPLALSWGITKAVNDYYIAPTTAVFAHWLDDGFNIHINDGVMERINKFLTTQSGNNSNITNYTIANQQPYQMGPQGFVMIAPPKLITSGLGGGKKSRKKMPRNKHKKKTKTYKKVHRVKKKTKKRNKKKNRTRKR